jgi:hypothetical protein
MASTIKKTANALSSESDLLNVYADLKAVCHKFESYLGVSESAQKRVLNWAEKRVSVMRSDPPPPPPPPPSHLPPPPSSPTCCLVGQGRAGGWVDGWMGVGRVVRGGNVRPCTRRRTQVAARATQ